MCLDDIINQLDSYYNHPFSPLSRSLRMTFKFNNCIFLHNHLRLIKRCNIMARNMANNSHNKRKHTQSESSCCVRRASHFQLWEWEEGISDKICAHEERRMTRSGQEHELQEQKFVSIRCYLFIFHLIQFIVSTCKQASKHCTHTHYMAHRLVATATWRWKTHCYKHFSFHPAAAAGLCALYSIF